MLLKRLADQWARDYEDFQVQVAADAYTGDATACDYLTTIADIELLRCRYVRAEVEAETVDLARFMSGTAAAVLIAAAVLFAAPADAAPRAAGWQMPAWGGQALVAEARRHIGATARQLGVPARLWCADFLNLVLKRTGRAGTGSRMALSFASYGRRVSGPQVGAIAVMSRGKRGGHVGVVSGIDASGNPVIISGNHNRRVAEATYPRHRILAYVVPR